MRHLKELLRLKYAAGLSHRQIAASLNISTGVVSKYVHLAEIAGVRYPVPEDIDDVRLHLLPGRTHEKSYLTDEARIKQIQQHHLKL